MREIKFRAWNGKEMMQVYGLTCSHSHMDLSRDDIEIEYGVFWDGEKIKLMQYTGLKDKGGKEIWEGDIIEYTRDDNSTSTGAKTKHKVVFANGAFCCLVNVIGLGTCPTYLSQYIENCEIIGNIYENPNLLEEK